MPLNVPQTPEFDPNDARLAKPTIDFEAHALPQAIVTLQEMGMDEADATTAISAREVEVKAKAKELGEAAYAGAENMGSVAKLLGEASSGMSDWLKAEFIDTPPE